MGTMIENTKDASSTMVARVLSGSINSIALFEELGSSYATLESSKIVDVCGLLKGNEQQCADAEQAYTQAKLRGPTRLVTLPREY